MSRSERSFLSRWSQLKRAGGEPPPRPSAAAAPAADLPPLPDPASLGFDDDFSAFLRREVAEGVRRTALKKLFHAEQFNVIDPLDIYIDDYTVASPIDAATIRTLSQARDLLLAEPAAAAVDAPDGPPAEALAGEPGGRPAPQPAEDPDAA